MSRAKALKGLFRMVTPYLTMKNVPLLAVNHTYKEIGLFPSTTVDGFWELEGLFSIVAVIPTLFIIVVF